MRIIYGVQGEKWAIKERRDKERDLGLMCLLPNFLSEIQQGRKTNTSLIKGLNEVFGLLLSNHLHLKDNSMYPSFLAARSTPRSFYSATRPTRRHVFKGCL